MKIGIPTELKAGETRVGLMPSAVAELVRAGHSVWVEADAGMECGFSNQQYRDAGAEIAADGAEVYARARLVVKVKEPQPTEVALLNERHLLFTYLHLAAAPELAQSLAATGVTAIAYETVTGEGGDLPLLTPMSEVAGRLSVQAGACHLENSRGGRGVLLGGVPGVAAANVVIIGGGVVGFQAAYMASALGARVRVFDKSLPRLRYLDSLFRARVSCEYATAEPLLAAIADADLVIGAVLVPGAKAPQILSREDIASMPCGSVIVDVAIDQGGCFATSKATTHQQPTYVERGVVHYCVANMPSAVGRTSTAALSHATLAYVRQLADEGLSACQQNPHLRAGVNLYDGQVTHKAVAEALATSFQPFAWPCD
ncbi:MAG TPA: alanine dehydrogenase [Cellvibrionaceae bacterium]